MRRVPGLPSEDEASDSVKRLERASCTSRLRKVLKESFGFLETHEQRDVLDFAVYEAWLVHRSRCIVRNESPKSFEDFLIEFHGLDKKPEQG
jgi:hypothetical protein